MERRKYLVLVFWIIILSIFITDLYASDPIVIADGQTIRFQQPLQTVRGAVLAPLQPITTQLNITYRWNVNTQTATVTYFDTEIIVEVDNYNMRVVKELWGETRPVTLSIPPRMQDGTPIFPIVDIFKALGAIVVVNSGTNIIEIQHQPSITFKNETDNVLHRLELRRVGTSDFVHHIYPGRTRRNSSQRVELPPDFTPGAYDVLVQTFERKISYVKFNTQLQLQSNITITQNDIYSNVVPEWARGTWSNQDYNINVTANNFTSSGGIFSNADFIPTFTRMDGDSTALFENIIKVRKDILTDRVHLEVSFSNRDYPVWYTFLKGSNQKLIIPSWAIGTWTDNQNNSVTIDNTQLRTTFRNNYRGNLTGIQGNNIIWFGGSTVRVTRNSATQITIGIRFGDNRYLDTYTLTKQSTTTTTTSSPTTSTTKTISSFGGKFTVSGPTDFFFTPNVTGRWTFRTQNNGTSDPTLELLDSNSRSLAFDDDGSDGYNSLITHYLTANTRYIIQADFHRIGSGAYDLVVSRESPTSPTTSLPIPIDWSKLYNKWDKFLGITPFGGISIPSMTNPSTKDKLDYIVGYNFGVSFNMIYEVWLFEAGIMYTLRGFEDNITSSNARLNYLDFSTKGGIGYRYGYLYGGIAFSVAQIEENAPFKKEDILFLSGAMFTITILDDYRLNFDIGHDWGSHNIINGYKNRNLRLTIGIGIPIN